MSQDTALKIMPIEQCTAVRNCKGDPKDYRYTNDTWRRERTPIDTAQVAQRALAEAWAKDQATHEKNAAAISNNRAVRDEVSALMARIEMPREWREVDHNSRARYPKHVTRTAGYLSDLSKHVPIDDHFQAAERSYNDLKARYDQYAKEAEQADENAKKAKEREAERAKEERRANIELATIILRYGLDLDATWEDVSEALRAKDQRLDLAFAMQETRGDWSDGFYRVAAALKTFDPTASEEDAAIMQDVASCMGDEDGRVFRDTAWNYGRIFESIADRQLVADAQRAHEKAQEGRW